MPTSTNSMSAAIVAVVGVVLGGMWGSFMFIVLSLGASAAIVVFNLFVAPPVSPAPSTVSSPAAPSTASPSQSPAVVDKSNAAASVAPATPVAVVPPAADAVEQKKEPVAVVAQEPVVAAPKEEKVNTEVIMDTVAEEKNKEEVITAVVEEPKEQQTQEAATITTETSPVVEEKATVDQSAVNAAPETIEEPTKLETVDTTAPVVEANVTAVEQVTKETTITTANPFETPFECATSETTTATTITSTTANDNPFTLSVSETTALAAESVIEQKEEPTKIEEPAVVAHPKPISITTDATATTSAAAAASPMSTTSSPLESSGVTPAVDATPSPPKLKPKDWSGTLAKQRKPGEINCWAPLEAAHFNVRGSNYLVDRKKIPSKPSLCTLFAMDLYSSPRQIKDLCSHNLTTMQCLRGPDDFVFAINFHVVLDTSLNFVMYFVLPHEETPENAVGLGLLKRFIDPHTPNAFRDARLKIIPTVTEGSWFVKRTVGSTPAILPNKITTTYAWGKNYFEADVDVTSSSVGTAIFKVVKGYVRTLVLDIAFVIEAQSPEELPEHLIGGTRLYNLAFDEQFQPFPLLK